MKHYYFVDNKILEFNFELNLDLNPSYIKLTQEQVDFYLTNPTASIYEIRNCQLNVPYQQSLDEIKQLALSQINEKSRETLGLKVDVLGFCDALASTIYAPARGVDSIYSTEEVLNTADDFLIIGKACRDRVNSDTELIENATTEEEVSQIVTAALNFFEGLTLESNDLEQHKQVKIREIDVYDSSEAVNGFFFNGILLWVNKDLRSNLVNLINSATLVGRDSINVWFSGLYIQLGLEQAREMLAAIEVYAADCFNVTAQHKLQVSNMTTIEEVIAFDVTTGYPERLQFNTIPEGGE